MTPDLAVQLLRKKLLANKGQARVPLIRARHGKTHFTVTLREDGVEVDNLHLQPFLPWRAFESVVRLLNENSGRARKGDAQRFRLGDSGLQLNSVEGRVASEIYESKPGDSVFRRITPIACLLEWAEVCRNGRGELLLLENSMQP